MSVKPFIIQDLADDKGTVIDARRVGPSSGGGGGEVTPASIVTATGRMSNDQKAQIRTNLNVVSTATMGAVYTRLEELEALVTATETISGTTPTITPEANTVYQCGELSSLTISNPPATGKYSIVFYSGATPTTTVGIENFAAEANKRYKITVEDNYATYDSWPYTPT